MTEDYNIEEYDTIERAILTLPSIQSSGSVNFNDHDDEFIILSFKAGYRLFPDCTSPENGQLFAKYMSSQGLRCFYHYSNRTDVVTCRREDLSIFK